MSVTATLLTNDKLASSASSYSTSTITPTANEIVIAVVTSYFASATPNIPTISGCNLTWTQIGTIDHWNNGVMNNYYRTTIFWGISSSPTSGAITFSFGGQNQVNAAWCITQLTGADKTNPIVQVISANTGGPGSQYQYDNITLNLSAFSNVNNATVGCISMNTSSQAYVAGSGFTIVGNSGIAAGSSNGTSCILEFATDNKRTVSASRLGTGAWGGIAFEVKSAIQTRSTFPGFLLNFV